MNDDSLLGQLAEDFIRRVREGKLPDLEEYANSYPDLAGRIRELFPTLMLLEGMAGDNVPSVVEATPSPLSAGSIFGNYRIEREIGRGGMGVVYEAIHVLLEKRVALKVLPVQTIADAAHLERFFREARIAAGLHHTNIVPVFDVGQFAGTPYFAMQYIEGSGLDRILNAIQSAEEQKFPPTTPPDSALETASEVQAFSEKEAVSRKTRSGTVRSSMEASTRIAAGLPARLEDYFRWISGIGIQAAEGLAYAHERKIIHRDIKPSNLLLDKQGVLWIADFGLARKIEDPAMTRSGALLGTPRYMSPEQAEAAERPIDHRSDIYSLGATLYELLTCRPVFEGKTPVEVLSQIVTREPAPPRRLNPEIPADLAIVVMKAMAKRPEDRYQSACELADDLAHWQKMEPIKARPIGPLGRAIRWRRRNPKLAFMAASAATVIFALSVIYYAGLIRENAKTRNALLNETHARLQAVDALKQAEFARNQAKISELRVDDARKTAETERDAAQTAQVREKAALESEKRKGYVANLLAADLQLRSGRPQEAQRYLFNTDPALRGWEWNHLFLKSDSSLATIYIPENGVSDNSRHSSTFAFTADGKAFFWSSKNVLYRWNIATNAPVAAYGGFGRIRAVSADGSMILTSGSEWQMQVIEPVTDRVVSTLMAVDGDVDSAAFSPDGSVVAAGSRDGTVRMFEADTGKHLFSLYTRGGSVLRIAIAGTGSRIAAGSSDGAVRLWDVKAWWDVKTVKLLKDLPQKVRNAKSSALAEQRYFPNPLGIMDHPGDAGWESGNVYNSDSATAIAFSRDSRYLAAGFTDGHIEAWDTSLDKFLYSIKGHARMVLSISYSPDNFSFASAGYDGAVRIWDVSSGTEQSALFDFSLSSLSATTNFGLNSVAYGPDGSQLFAGSNMSHIKIWNVRNCQGIESMRAPGRSLRGIAFSPDGARVVSGSLDGTAILWGLASGKPVQNLRGHKSSILSAAFSPNGKKIATASEDATARIWDAQSGRELAVLTGHSDAITSIRFSPDGAKLATGSADASARIWDSQSGKQLFVLTHPSEKLQSVAFSPDGNQIATGTYSTLDHPSDISVRLWDSASGRNLKNFSCADLHNVFMITSAKSGQKAIPVSGVFSVAFSPDGKRIAASLPFFEAIGIWDVASGKAVATLRGQTAGSFAFSPDGIRIISCPLIGSTFLHDPDRSIRVWDAYSSELLYTLAGASDDLPVQEVAFSPDGARIASISDSSILKIWNSKSVYPPYLPLDVLQQIAKLQVRSKFREDQIAYLKNDAKLDAGLRQAAFFYLSSIPDNTDKLNAASFQVVKSPDSKPELYRQALRQAQTATRTTPWRADYLITLVIAQYRAGDYSGVLGTCERLNYLFLPANGLAFKAMALFKLGRVDEASQALEQLRSLIKNSSQSPDADLQGFLREAEALITHRK
jgi:eukaryotic-like serine/threonine-protein kinase